jgi:hypothetical protein
MNCFTLEDGTDRFSRNVGTTVLRCVKSQNRADPETGNVHINMTPKRVRETTVAVAMQ